MPRSLLEKMKRGTAEDGEIRARVECRRSCRLSPSLPSIPPDLSGVLDDGMSPIAEGVESIEMVRPTVADSGGVPVRFSLGVVAGDLSDGREGEQDMGFEVVADSTSGFADSQAMVEGLCQREGVAECPSDFDDSVTMVQGVCHRNGFAGGTVHGDHGFPSPVADKVSPSSLVAGGIVQTSPVNSHFPQAVQVVSQSQFSTRSADASSCGGVAPASCRVGDVRPETAEPSRVDCVVAVDVSRGSMNDVVLNSEVGAFQNGPGTDSILFSLSDDVSLGGGGMVREEGRAPPVAKEAVRPQPTDGLRQLPRSLEEPLPAQPGEASRPAPDAQPVTTERALAGLQTTGMGTRTTGGG
ncbi:hypothetical protein Dimus_036574, partial [Dionaea muscipula]